MVYIPCILAIYKHMKSSSCYKLMFYIGVCDVLCLPITALVTGYFAITGAVYCSHPTLMYILGSIAPELWYAESFAAALLALNRCLTINYPKLAGVVFDGRRTWYILVVPTLYAIWIGVFFKSAFFNGILCSWFSNPHIGYLDVPEDKLFLQVLLISFIHTFCAVIYDLIQFKNTVTEIWTISAQFAWVFAHGSPGIIYLLFNETIRSECRSYFGTACQNKVAPSSQPQENCRDNHCNSLANTVPVASGTIQA
ncbi:serpentine type 7TM GPCR chemoreceptor srt domain-containing protein [Ditylenchus destructor]|uniref:Serpentine type 7TM GPCR chemoreceptor srt domain-containing protein n=1 Tax=Ditylenchus destructor TaxID=166010 RepID=A0AAD4MKE0_9BILA|nr:serpentine type 7TM GPCR chemoreceptor srt domain-containing protein [Ditylenchus destructor]